MATIDMTQRKLNFPPRFLPYLEKHRIFELFHECVELLVQMKPKDHIKFLKNILPCAAMKKDRPRIVFISPASFDRINFAEFLAECLGIQNINLSHLEFLTREKMMTGKDEIETISESYEEECYMIPGEGEYGPLYFPAEAEPFQLEAAASEMTPVESEEQEVEEEEKKEEKPPCICVCPCVKKEEEEENKIEEKVSDEEKGEEEEKEEEEKEDAEEKGEDEEKKESIEGEAWGVIEGLRPCKKRPRCRKFQRSFINPTISESSSTVEIDFGFLTECEINASGWILEDFPKTGEEAEKLNATGIIPTHALRIIVDEEAEEEDPQYKMIVKNWMRAYKFVPVLTIRVGDRTMQELIKDLCSLLSIMPHRHAPMLPRIVLIGSRGSGVTTQGQKLAKKYGLVHVEFETVIAQALQKDDDICKLYKIQLATRPDPELEAFILERALLTSPCRNRGWVLTGYPTNCDQMRMLDITATPPNRVIFIEVPARECFVRLYYRKTDGCLGDEYKLPMIEPFGVDSYKTPDIDPETAARLLSHPKDDKKQVIHDIEQYFLEKKNIMAYCGKTASYVDGNQEADKVFEQIEQVLINPAPPQPPRNPLSVNHGIDESHERLKKFRLAGGLFFNNLFLNPPERVLRR